MILSEIAELLEAGKEYSSATMVRNALSGRDETPERFLVSNELWGGSGSIADQAFVDDRDRLKTLEGLLVRLGKLQINSGKTNTRTESWVAAFEQWRQAGLRN